MVPSFLRGAKKKLAIVKKEMLVLAVTVDYLLYIYHG
jgi:hypothetical protein